MKKRELMIICGVVAVVLQITAICHAVPVFVDTVAADFDSLLGGLAYALDDEMISDFSGGNLLATIISQSFTDGAGSFLYLYQLKNTGTVDTEVITRFTASPYASAGNSISLGYLTANIPTAFTAGDQAPLYGDVDALSGPTVGFNFSVGNPFYGIPDSYIVPGESSLVLYVQSNLGPGIIVGNIINGGVHTGEVYGPVPEPATICLLGIGGLLLRRRKSTV
jgi:hypothetical protein